jgi:hypothetical protein
MKHLEHVRNRISEAFQRANEVHGVTGKVKPKVFDGSLNLQAAVLATKQSTEPIYGEKESALFQKQANSLIGAVQSPYVMLHRQQLHYYVGDLNKQTLAEDLFAEAMREPAKTESKKERKKAPFFQHS